MGCFGGCRCERTYSPLRQPNVKRGCDWLFQNGSMNCTLNKSSDANGLCSGAGTLGMLHGMRMVQTYIGGHVERFDQT